jgi:hypothetical protein
MPGLKPLAGLRVILAGACAITWISAAHPAIAQLRCMTGDGLSCAADPAPPGTPCSCFTARGLLRGVVLPPPSSDDSTFCETRYGYCRISPSRVQSYCECENDPGIVVVRPK